MKTISKVALALVAALIIFSALKAPKIDSGRIGSPNSTNSQQWQVSTVEVVKSAPKTRGSGGAAEGTSIDVPSDANAAYSVVDISTKVNGRVTITTNRRGSSGQTFSRRECDCGANKFRYLGDGSTLADAKKPISPPEQFVDLVAWGGMGSVSHHVCKFACSFYRY